jgi:FAD/FMN-containing dehydrogenase
MTIDPAALRQFRETHRGDVITPEDERYDRARRVWNAMIEKRPLLIARPRTSADVIACLQLATANHLPVAIRGGAHSIAGRSTCDDGIVIDFADMKKISVDSTARTAVAEPGVRWQDFDRETQAHGLATTGGTVGDTGIAGLTLGGGFGWLEGKFGMTVDNLIAADVVLAGGELVRASETEHPDLFWALRGGGGNFGIVTSFTYRLHEVGQIVGGLIMHPFAHAADVLTHYNEFMRSAPDALVAAAVLLTGPDGNKACAVAVAYVGDLTEGQLAVAPLKRFGTPVLDVIGPMPYLAQQALIDQAMPANLLNYWKAEFIPEVSADVIARAIDAYSRVPSPISSILFFPIHGAASRVPSDATAFPHRSGYHMGIYSLWNDRSHNGPNIGWVRDLWTAVQPFAAGGVYVNEIGDDEGSDRVKLAYGGNYERLERIKAKYDPNNLFCLNANILPMATQ